MKIKAAVAWQSGQPLSIEEIEIQGPKKGEVLIKMVATGVCHTDAYTLSGADPEGNGTKLSLLNTFFTSMRKLFHLTSWHGHQLTWFRPSFNTSGLIPA